MINYKSFCLIKENVMTLKKIIITAWCCLFVSTIILCSSQFMISDQILNKLTLEEKIGQLFVVALKLENNQGTVNKTYDINQQHVKQLISEYHVGGVIFLGLGSCEKQVALTQELQRISKIPLLIVQDLEWGLTMRLSDAVKFPRNQTLGALSPEHDYLIYQMGYQVGRQCKSIGVHMNLAPVVDINNNPNNPVINDRSFGENKERVATKGILFMNGLQDAGIIACAKHFPGHGDTNIDSHHDLPIINHPKERLYDCELYPFVQMINSGIKAIMSAHLQILSLESQENVPSSLSFAVINKLLKQELGFSGIVITDGLDMKGVTKHHELGTLELQALQAGNDILLCSVDVPKAIATIKQAIIDGTFSLAELNKRVAKILELKIWAGCSSSVPDFNYQDLHTPESYLLKQKLYSHAITLVKDDAQLLPITLQIPCEISCIQIGKECSTSDFNTILNQELFVSSYAISADTDKQSVDSVIFQIQNDTVIVSLLGMSKSAKKQYSISPSTIYCLEELKKAGKKIIVVVFGNAYSLPLIKDASTIIMAYEDDIDAQTAAAQVVMGKIKATGILPVLNSK